MRVSLIGMGCGGAEQLLPAAAERLREAERIVGAARLLAALPPHAADTVSAVRPEEIEAALLESGAARAAVVFSGDTGFFSGAARLLRRLSGPAYETELIPGVSSVQAFAAALGKPWQDWTLCSAHGVRCDVLAELKKGRPVFLLTGGAEDPARIGRELTEAGLGECPVCVGEELSGPCQRIRRVPARDLAVGVFAPLNVLLVDPVPEMFPKLRAPGIPDGEFFRGETPMTKQEVRATVLGKLAVGPEDLCWDVGAGTGSVSVELALAGRGVWAVERDAGACGLIRQNREKFRAWNLRLVEGAAPETLEDLPAPDAVFVGGSGGALEAILDQAMEANPAVRLCVSAIALETLHRAADWMEKAGLEPEITQIAVSRTRRAGGLHLMTANNPVFLITGGRP